MFLNQGLIMKREIIEKLVSESFEILNKLPDSGIKELETYLLRAYKKQERILENNYKKLLSRPSELSAEVNRLQQLKIFYETVSNRTTFILSPKNSIFSDSILEIVEEIDIRLQEWSSNELVDLLSNSSDLGDVLAKDAIRLASNQSNQQFGSVNINFLENIEDSRLRLFNYSKETASRIVSKISDNLLLGTGSRDLKKVLIDEINLTAWKAEQLARTESARILNLTSKSRYNSSNIKYGQWFTTPQEKYPCIYCASRSGNVYRLEEIIIPAHPSCYCFLSPYSFDWETDREFIKKYSENARKIANIKDSDRMNTSLLPTPFEVYDNKSAPIPIEEF